MLIRTILWCSILILICAISALAQADVAPHKTDGETKTKPPSPAAPPSVRIFLTAGGFTVADEASESADGIWYKRGNVTTFLERSRVKYVETKPSAEVEQSIVKARWKISDAHRIEKFFQETFNRPLPLSSFGQSDIHNRWGLDHRNGMDVGLHPDTVEGRTLIGFLREQQIPFLIFRGPIPRVATGPHIHIGNASSRTR